MGGEEQRSARGRWESLQGRAHTSPAALVNQLREENLVVTKNLEIPSFAIFFS
jgi:hypothetical protein